MCVCGTTSRVSEALRKQVSCVTHAGVQLATLKSMLSRETTGTLPQVSGCELTETFRAYGINSTKDFHNCTGRVAAQIKVPSSSIPSSYGGQQ